MNKPKYIVIHHTAVSRKKNPEQYEAVRNYHKSKGWGEISYHYLIEPSGLLMWGRKENQPGAHVKEKNINYESIGLCLTGNFDEEAPTKEQLDTLKQLIIYLRKKYKIPRSRVRFHRDWANYKSCPGRWWTRARLEAIMPMSELFRDEKGGFWFCKNGDKGKQKVDSLGGLMTVISREFGVETKDEEFFDNLENKKYF